MNVLSIGNSFSQDAQRYLHQIAKADGTPLDAFNLYIGGCSLSRHYRNMLSGEKVYGLEVNGHRTGFLVSLKEALLNRDWDVVTLQQVSALSPCYETYQPYLSSLAAYVRECVPKAEIAIHQTWAYEKDSSRLVKELGYRAPAEMLRDIKAAYKKAAKEIGADFIIPSGEVFQKMLTLGVEKMHRDTYHASYGLGRYALGLLWHAVLTGQDVSKNAFCDFDEEVAASDCEKAKESVLAVLSTHKNKRKRCKK